MSSIQLEASAMGLAWIVIERMRMSIVGLYFFVSLTGVFSSASNVSNPSITLSQK